MDEPGEKWNLDEPRENFNEGAPGEACLIEPIPEAVAALAPPELIYGARWRAPMTAMGAIDATFNMIRARPAAFFGVFVPYLMAQLIEPCLRVFVYGEVADAPHPFVEGVFGMATWPDWILDPFTTGAVYIVAARMYHGERARFGDILRSLAAVLVPLMVVETMTNLALSLCLWAFFVPFIFLWGRIIFAVPYVLFEKASIVNAFKRSLRDGAAHPWLLIRVAACLVGMIFVVTFATAILANGRITESPLPFRLVTDAFIGLLQCYSMLLSTWFYFERQLGWAEAQARQ